MLPLGYEKVTPTSPIFNYPYERSREALEQMRRQEEWGKGGGNQTWNGKIERVERKVKG